jgi:hypothetical protein
MGVLQVDPLNSQSIDLLKRAEELLSMDAVKETIADDKIVRDWETIQEAFKYLANNHPKENSVVRDVLRILLSAYNMPNISDEELRDINHGTKKVKNLGHLSRRGSSTSLKNPFKRRTSQPRTSLQASAAGASETTELPSPPAHVSQTRIPSRPAPHRERSLRVEVRAPNSTSLLRLCYSPIVVVGAPER